MAGNFGIINQFGFNPKGFFAQNLIYFSLQKLREHKSGGINFWRTQDGVEVDFVLNIPEGDVPYEVKDRELRKAEITRSFRAFITKYSPKVWYIVSKTELPPMMIGETEVRFISVGGVENI